MVWKLGHDRMVPDCPTSTIWTWQCFLSTFSLIHFHWEGGKEDRREPRMMMGGGKERKRRELNYFFATKNWFLFSSLLPSLLPFLSLSFPLFFLSLSFPCARRIPAPFQGNHLSCSRSSSCIPSPFLPFPSLLFFSLLSLSLFQRKGKGATLIMSWIAWRNTERENRQKKENEKWMNERRKKDETYIQKSARVSSRWMSWTWSRTKMEQQKAAGFPFLAFVPSVSLPSLTSIHAQHDAREESKQREWGKRGRGREGEEERGRERREKRGRFDYSSLGFWVQRVWALFTQDFLSSTFFLSSHSVLCLFSLLSPKKFPLSCRHPFEDFKKRMRIFIHPHLLLIQVIQPGASRDSIKISNPFLPSDSWDSFLPSLSLSLSSDKISSSSIKEPCLSV